MKKQMNPKATFNMGIIFTGAGVVFLNSVNKTLGIVFIALGLSYMILGTKRKNKKSK